MFSLIPDKYVENFYDITPSLIKHMRAKAVFVDLDGTLVSKDTKTPTAKVINWIEDFKKADIAFVIISNNSNARVSAFCTSLNIPFISTAKKPFPTALKKAISGMNINPCEVVMIGDQIFTDTFASRNFGGQSIYVKPIDKNSLYVKFRTSFTEKYFVNKAKEK